MNALKIANGLKLDFTIPVIGVGDSFLSVASDGTVTQTPVITVDKITPQTASRVAVFNGFGFLAPSQSNTTELDYLIGVTSSIQNQLNAKQAIIALLGNRLVVSTGSGGLGTIGVTDVEAGYLAGLSSSLQTQLNAKQATITGGATTIVSANLTVTRALVSDGSGKVAVSAVTSTELGYVSGVTSALQTQLTGKLSATITTPTTGQVITYNGSAWVNSSSAAVGVPVGGSTGQYLIKNSGTNYDTVWHTLVAADLTNVTSTAAELNLVHGVTTSTVQFNYLNTVSSDVQTQINARLINNLALNAMWIGNASNIAIQLSAGTSGYVLTSVSGVPTWQPAPGGGAGIAGPGTSTLNAVVRWSNTLGTVVKDSPLVVTDAGLMTGGTWNGNLVTGQYGGTGVANTGKTITLGGNLTTSGAFASTFTMTNTTAVTFPISGTLLSTTNLLNGNGTTWTAGTPAYDWGGTLVNNVLINGAYQINIGGITPITAFNVSSTSSGLISLTGAAFAVTSINVNIASGTSFNVDGAISVGFGQTTPVTNFKVTATTFKFTLGSDAIGDIYQRDAAGNFTRLAAVATGNVLISGGVAAVNSWGKVDLTAHISGILPMANGGTGANLVDPAADKIVAWDDTDNSIGFWILGSGLTYTHSTHTLTAAGGGGTPGGSNTQIQFNNSGAFGGNANFTINNGTGVVTMGQIPIFTLGIGSATAVTQAIGDNSTKVATTAYVDNLTLPSFTTTLDGYTLASGGAGRLLLGDNSWLAAAATGNVLLSGTTPSWGKVTLTTHVSGNLGLANGGTGVSLADPAAHRLWGWDDTDNLIAWITIGTGLTYTSATHTLTSSGTGITNTAAANELMKSDGTNAVPSGTFSTAAGDLTFGTGLTGTVRTLKGEGSGANIDVVVMSKGTGVIQFSNPSSSAYISFSPANNSLVFGPGAAVIAPASNVATGDNLAVHGGDGITNGNGGSLYLNGGTKAGSGVSGNIGFFVNSSGTFGGGEKVVFFANATTNPTTNPTNGGIMFVKSADNKPYWRTPAGVETIMLGGTGGITNTAAANEMMKSDGTNAVPSGVFSTVAGDLTFGTGVSGTVRTLTATGTGSNIDMYFVSKGSGQIAMFSNVLSLINSTNPASFTRGIVLDATTPIIYSNELAAISTQFIVRGSTGNVTTVTGQDLYLRGGDAYQTSGNNKGGNLYLSVGAPRGTETYGNVGFFTNAGSFGGGGSIMFIANATTVPTTSITGGAGFYVDPVTQHPMWVIGTEKFDLLEPISFVSAMLGRNVM